MSVNMRAAERGANQAWAEPTGEADITGDCGLFCKAVQAVQTLVPHARTVIAEIIDGDHLISTAASGPGMDKIGYRLSLPSTLSGKAIAERRTIYCADMAAEFSPAPTGQRQPSAKSVAIVPLAADGEIVGVLKMLGMELDAFGEQDLNALNVIASMTSAALAKEVLTPYAMTERLERRLEATFDKAPVGIAHVSPDGRFLSVNDRFCEIAGRGSSELLCYSFQDITHPDDLDQDVEQLAQLMSGEIDRYAMDKRYIRPNGSEVWVRLTVSLVQEGNRPDFFVAVVEDLSDIRKAKEEAQRDYLTGLLNRRGLMHAMHRVLADRAADRSFSLIYLDLDGFKRVNDSLGHDEGDSCLMMAATALKAAVRPGDVVARIGGDEFIVMLNDVAAAQLAPLAERIRRAIPQAVRQRWQVDASAGAIHYRSTAKLRVDDILRAADGLMYEAKAAGKAQLRLVDSHAGTC